VHAIDDAQPHVQHRLGLRRFRGQGDRRRVALHRAATEPVEQTVHRGQVVVGLADTDDGTGARTERRAAPQPGSPGAQRRTEALEPILVGVVPSQVHVELRAGGQLLDGEQVVWAGGAAEPVEGHPHGRGDLPGGVRPHAENLDEGRLLLLRLR